MGLENKIKKSLRQDKSKYSVGSGSNLVYVTSKESLNSTDFALDKICFGYPRALVRKLTRTLPINLKK